MGRKKKFNAVGAYIFAGGFTLGVEQEFNILAHLEGSDYGVATFKKNRPGVPVHPDPLGWPLHDLSGNVQFVYCNPPCAIFSVVGRSIRNGADNWKTDERLQCHHNCFSLLEKLEPDVLAIESVPIAYKRGLELWDKLAAEAKKLGYATTHLFEDAQWFGLPQKRSRYLLVFHRVKLNVERNNWAPAPALMESIGHLRSEPGFFHPVRPDQLPAYEACQQGEGLRTAWERLNPPETWVRGPTGVRGRPRFCEYRARADEPIGAFIGDFVIHPLEHRKLGLEEAKAVCGFPPEFVFDRPGPGFSELARGVMPPVGAWLARSVARSLEEDKSPKLETTIVDRRSPEKEAA